jgi:nucleotide-binding universal stress UspA family protein
LVYGKILVPLDGSELAEGVLPYVRELAGRFDSEVVLLQVVTPVSRLLAETAPVSMGEATLGAEAASEAAEAERKEAMSYLEGVVRRLKAGNVSARWEVIEGIAGDVIVEYAHREGVDLIAMSTHGRSGLVRLVYGSVADHVLRHAGTPVLLVRSRKAKA